MSIYTHQRHKPSTPLQRERELVVACMPMRSNVNISAIARTASASAIDRLVLTGHVSLITKIARDGATAVNISTHRTLAPVLKRLREAGHRLVGLEQTTNSLSLYEYTFTRRTTLVVGNERTGLSEHILEMLDEVVEIPVYGLPHSFNVATAASIAIYEYCKQFPSG